VSGGSLLGLVGAGLTSVAIGACVLVDPPATLPAVTQTPPVITSVSPPEGPLVTWPAGFTINVGSVTPGDTVEVKAFLDYDYSVNPANPANPANQATWAPLQISAPADASGEVHVLLRDIGAPPGPGCHTLTVVVAYAFAQADPSIPNEDPSAGGVGGDSDAWSYAPVSGYCFDYDAGSLLDGTIATDSGT